MGETLTYVPPQEARKIIGSNGAVALGERAVRPEITVVPVEEIFGSSFPDVETGEGTFEEGVISQGAVELSPGVEVDLSLTTTSTAIAVGARDDGVEQFIRSPKTVKTKPVFTAEMRRQQDKEWNRQRKTNRNSNRSIAHNTKVNGANGPTWYINGVGQPRTK